VLAITQSSNGIDRSNRLSSPEENLSEAARQYQAGNHKEAKNLCEKLVKEEPHNADALNFLGLMDHEGGAHVAAADWIEKALAIEPKNAAFHYNFGETMRAQDKIDEAIASYYRAIGFDPTFVNAYTNIGVLCLNQNRLPEAVDVLRRATAYTPTDGAAYARLGAAQTGRGDLDEALTTFAQAIQFDPDNPAYIRHFIEALNAYPFPAMPSGVLMALRTCFDFNGISHQGLVPAATAVLKRDERFAGLLAMTESDDIVTIMAAAAGGVFDDFLSEPLLLGLLANTIITDDQLIRVLTTLRRVIVLQGGAKTDPKDFVVGRRRQFVFALALQCFVTDYAWYETKREALAAGYIISEVRRGLDAIISGHDESAWDLEMWNRLAVVATYRPIYRIQGVDKLLELGLPAESPYRRMLIQQQLLEPIKERQFSSQIIHLGDPALKFDSTEIESSPYPRWHQISTIEPRNLADGLEELIPGFIAPEYARRPVRLLVVGCTTGKLALKLAAAYQNIEVLATDSVQQNLAYAARMAEEMNIGNIEFCHVERQELYRIEDQFHVIYTGESLLWTDDALTPWQMLVDRLIPEGLMQIQVRSAVQREGLVAAREFVRSKGFSPDAEGVRSARQAILDLPDGEVARRIVTATGFYNFYQCRNLLFPDYEEARFDIAGLRDAMAEFGLKFLAYEAQKQMTMTRFLEEFGEAAEPTNLDQWAKLEERYPMDLSTIHRVWCQKPA
jgi:tetratricopeptide (TPR) repeat protein/SAM-dependent methyltransferase